MSEASQDTDSAELEELTDGKTVVVDPDDYQKTRKLKAINDAKDHVRKLRRDRPDQVGQKEWRTINARTAEAVAMFGNELVPLIEDALEQGLLGEEDLETEYGSLMTFIHCDGLLPNREEEELQNPKRPAYMSFYRQLERIQRKLGLGLELREDKDPASI
jgi:hypothetical protein